MSVLDLMKRRCSVRVYEDRRVERDKLLYVLEAARVAPSACNIQPWRFIVIQQAKRILAIAPAWVADSHAPVLIVACGNHRSAWHRGDGKDHCDIDLAIAVDHMTLAAADIGLGTCWICSFDADSCKRQLKLADDEEPIVLLPLGYPAESKSSERHDEERKTMREIIEWIGA